MKRRSFVKKSFASAIVAATPLALTGLVNAAGGGSGTQSETTSSPSSTTGWFGTTYNPDVTSTVPATTDYFTTPYSDPYGNGATCGQQSLQRYQSIDDQQVNVCWFPGRGHDPNRDHGDKDYDCAMFVTPCHQIVPGVSTQAQIDEAVACMALPYASMLSPC